MIVSKSQESTESWQLYRFCDKKGYLGSKYIAGQNAWYRINEKLIKIYAANNKCK